MNQTKHQKMITKTALVIFLIANCFYFYEYLLQVSPSIMTDLLMKDFNIDATSLGITASFFFFSYTLFQIPAGLIIDRVGARLTLTTVTLICALGALIFGLAPNIIFTAIGRFLMGLAGSFAFIGVLYLIIRWFPKYFFALFVGLTQLIGAIGAIGGEGPLRLMTNTLGWRLSMMLFSLVGLVIAVITFAIVRDRPTGFHEDIKQKPNIFKTLHIIVRNKQTWMIAIYSFCIWAPIVAFAALWGIPFLKLECSLSSIQAADAMSIIWVGVAIFSPFVGWISDKMERRCLPLSILAIIGCAAITGIIFIQQLPIIAVYILLFFVGVAAAGQSLIFGVVNDINSTDTSSAAIGLNNMATVAGGAIFQPLIGRLLDLTWDGKIIQGVPFYTIHSYHIALLTMPLCFFIAFLMSTFFIKETHCKECR